MEKIMIIDDEEIILKSVRELLTNEGYEVEIATSGEEGIEKMKKNKPDLLILDFFMPEMSGGAILKRVRQDPELKDLKVVFLTVASTSSTGMRMLEKMNILDYIKKPFNNKDLVQRIKKAIK